MNASPLQGAMALSGPYGMAAAGAVGLFQGFLGFMASKKQNDAAQAALNQLNQQEQFYNASFQDRLGLLQQSQMLNWQNLFAAIPQMRRQQQMEYAAAAGAARTALAESGAATSGSKADLLQSIDVQGLLNQRAVEQNISSQLMSNDLNYRSAVFGATQQYYSQEFQIKNTRAGIEAQMQSPWLQGVSSGIGGFGTGLNIVTGIRSLNR